MPLRRSQYPYTKLGMGEHEHQVIKITIQDGRNLQMCCRFCGGGVSSVLQSSSPSFPCRCGGAKTGTGTEPAAPGAPSSLAGGHRAVTTPGFLLLPPLVPPRCSRVSPQAPSCAPRFPPGMQLPFPGGLWANGLAPLESTGCSSALSRREQAKEQ